MVNSELSIITDKGTGSHFRRCLKPSPHSVLLCLGRIIKWWMFQVFLKTSKSEMGNVILSLDKTVVISWLVYYENVSVQNLRNLRILRLEDHFRLRTTLSTQRFECRWFTWKEISGTTYREVGSGPVQRKNTMLDAFKSRLSLLAIVSQSYWDCWTAELSHLWARRQEVFIYKFPLLLD